MERWKKDSKHDFGDRYYEVVPDLAENFLVSVPGVRDFLIRKGLRNSHTQREYITDLLA